MCFLYWGLAQREKTVTLACGRKNLNEATVLQQLSTVPSYWVYIIEGIRPIGYSLSYQHSSHQDSGVPSTPWKPWCLWFSRWVSEVLQPSGGCFRMSTGSLHCMRSWCPRAWGPPFRGSFVLGDLNLAQHTSCQSWQRHFYHETCRKGVSAAHGSNPNVQPCLCTLILSYPCSGSAWTCRTCSRRLNFHAQRSRAIFGSSAFCHFQTCAKAMERLLKAAAPAYQVLFRFQMCNHSGGKITGCWEHFL